MSNDDPLSLKRTRYRNMKGVRLTLDALYPDGWGDTELDAYIIGQEDKRRQNETAVRSKQTARQRGLSKLTRQYESRFEDVTPNDRAVIRQLAFLEIEMKAIQEKLGADDVSASERKALLEASTKASTEFRQLQTALGIARSDREESTSIAQEIRGLIDGASKLFKDRAKAITCPHCEGAQSKIRLGFILWHFAGEIPFTFSAVCPKCGNPIEVNQKTEILAI